MGEGRSYSGWSRKPRYGNEPVTPWQRPGKVLHAEESTSSPRSGVAVPGTRRPVRLLSGGQPRGLRDRSLLRRPECCSTGKVTWTRAPSGPWPGGEPHGSSCRGRAVPVNPNSPRTHGCSVAHTKPSQCPSSDACIVRPTCSL